MEYGRWSDDDQKDQMTIKPLTIFEGRDAHLFHDTTLENAVRILRDDAIMTGIN